MHDQTTRAVLSTAIAQAGPMSQYPFTLAALPGAPGKQAAETSSRPGQLARLRRFASTAAHHPITTGRTCVHAAKMLPTVRKALPWYTWPILALAAIMKMMPLDFGTDEALFCVAFLLILWRRPGLLDALYREAQAGKPAQCGCPSHARKVS